MKFQIPKNARKFLSSSAAGSCWKKADLRGVVLRYLIDLRWEH
jgi:hypothetical protein